MGKLYDRLQEQLTTEYKKDAEDCLKIYEHLKKIDDGHVWSSKWNLLTRTTFKGFPSDDRRYELTQLGRDVLNGISLSYKN